MAKKDNHSLPMLTRAQFIECLVERQSNLTVRDVEEATKKILECMISSLNEGRRIEVRGFGSFSLRTRKAYIARNPKTGKTFQSQQKSVPYFKAGKQLREQVNNLVNGINAPDKPFAENLNEQYIQSVQTTKTNDF